MISKELFFNLVKYAPFNWEQIMEQVAEMRLGMQQNNAPLLRDFPEIFTKVYIFRIPITRETKIMEAFVVDILDDGDMDGRYFQFLAEDKELYKEVDECVAGTKKDEVQRILDELRDDMEASGEFD